MKQQILTQFPWLGLSSVALLIFFTFFVALLVITSLKPQRKIQERAARIPLDEGQLIKENRHVGF